MLAHPSEFPSRRPKLRKRRVGLTLYEEQRLRQQLRQTACSEPWVEAQFVTADDVDQNGSAIVYRYHDPHVFPPGGAKTGMRRCPACSVITPSIAFEHGNCLDHADHRGWGPSPSAVAIRALQMFNLRFEFPDLPPEDSVSLRKEIRRFLARRKSAQQS